MPPILNAQGLTKAYGPTTLFEGISFTVSEADRIGLIGPNGSGKSTLLGILAGNVRPDAGDLATRKNARLSLVLQSSEYQPGKTVRAVVEQALKSAAVPLIEHEARLAEVLGRAGFEDLEAKAASLSGGWQKRLAIVEALVQALSLIHI